MEKNPPKTHGIRELIESAYAEMYSSMAERIDALYQEVGARAVYGVSYAGEDPVRLDIPPEQSYTSANKENRPA